MKPLNCWIRLAASLAMAAIAVSTGTRVVAEEPVLQPFDIKAHFQKYEYSIPMRDGAKLFTAVYVPRDKSVAYPFFMLRTAFTVAPYGPDQYPARLDPSDKFMRSGYIFVFQDVRGRGRSEGAHDLLTPHRDVKLSPTDTDESSDTHDTVEWLLRHVPNHNGRVGIWGVSYNGFYTAAGIIDSHPAIKAASPQAPVTDFYMGDDRFHGGAFMLAHTFHPPVGSIYQDEYELLLGATTLARATALQPTVELRWKSSMLHPTYDDFWRARNIAPHLRNIHCAVLTVGGWFDAEDLAGTFNTYHAIENNNPGIPTTLVMGPWAHGGWIWRQGHSLGSVDFGSNTSEFFRDQIMFPFFEHYLKDRGDAKLPKAYVFETGTNVWRQYRAWPPPGTHTRTLFFRDHGGLSFDAPAERGLASDRYVSDPAKPVPFVGYISSGMTPEFMIGDQRFASCRPDVMVYATAPLTQDVTIVGPVSPHLYVSTTATDSDWIVKLIDVYPPDLLTPAIEPKPLADVPPPKVTLAGYQQLVRGEPFRGKYRHSFEKPEPFVPGKVESVNFTMPDVNHTFRRGHRIMVQVQSTWFPLMDLNPQTFVNIPDAKPEDFQPATEQIFRSSDQASGIEVGVLDKTTQTQ